VILYERGEEELRAALNRPLEIDFRGQSLKDAVLFFAEQLRVPPVLCVKKLEEAGISPDTPVTLMLPRQPAGAALSAMLKPLELTWLIRDEVLQITSCEDAASQRITRLFDVRPLLTDSLTQVRLIDVLERQIPQLSPERGQPRMVVGFRGILIVQAEATTVEEVQSLITDPQELRRLAEKPAAQKENEDANSTRPKVAKP
jgi:hypothetical protein